MKNIVLLFSLILFLNINNYSQITQAIDFTVTDSEGVEHNLFDHLDEGRYVFIQFYLVTCPACIGGIPAVNNLYTSFGCNEFDLIVLGIGNPTEADMNAYIEDHEVIFPLVGSEGGGGNVLYNYEISGVPVYILIKPDHSVEYINSPTVPEVASHGPNESACPDEFPIANFTASPTQLAAGDSVYFTNLSNEYSTQWEWILPGSLAGTYHGYEPGGIVYDEPGLHDVTLIASNEVNNRDTLVKHDYIFVTVPGDTLPTPAFTASQLTVIAGNSISFTDLSSEHPYWWQWEFDGANPETSFVQNPSGITYNNVGTYDVTLTVQNSFGFASVTYEDYITVIPEPGTEAPVARFSSTNRLIQRGEKVNFIDESDNLPTTWHWSFEGGLPPSANTQIIPLAVQYNTTGYFDVTLNVSNINGADVLRKKDYVVVYDSFVGKVCDTITTLKSWETANLRSFPGGTGYMGGRNSENIDAYADYFDHHTFTVINGIILPVAKLNLPNQNSTVKIIAWDGDNDYPKNEIASHTLKLNTLTPNYSQVVNFDEPFEIEGPFYLGYTVNYFSTEEFAVGLSSNRGPEGDNTLFARKDSIWYSTKSEYGFAGATGIKPMVCLVGIENYEIEKNISIYPNPANENVFVQFDKYFKKGDFVQLYNAAGQMVKHIPAEYHTNEISLNIENLKTGIYTIHIFIDGMIYVDKITIVN